MCHGRAAEYVSANDDTKLTILALEMHCAQFRVTAGHNELPYGVTLNNNHNVLRRKEGRKVTLFALIITTKQSRSRRPIDSR
jgi:hypothetical protein